MNDKRNPAATVPGSGTYRLQSHEFFSGDGWTTTSSGLILPPAAMSLVRKPKLTAISLFTGAGGFDLGFIEAGFRILTASDYDPVCAWTYCYNVGARPVQFHFLEPQDRDRFLKRIVKPSKGNVTLDTHDRAFFERPASYERVDNTPHYFLGDVRKLSGEHLLQASGVRRGDVDVVFGGPPCQGFSKAGRREVMDPRNSLVFDFARLILEISPKTMVMENVPDIVSMVTPEGIPVVDAFCKILADGNYADFQSLKKSLTSHPEARAALKGQGKERGHMASSEQPERETMQMHLFGL